MTETCDVCVIGGGIIGLSIAHRLAMAGRRVVLLERDRPGRQASWAGAGMLPPGSPFRGEDFNAFMQESHALWPGLSETLREQTGLDNGFLKCGGLEVVADSEAREAHLAAWRGVGVEAIEWSADDVDDTWPMVGTASGAFYSLPDHWQVRNPRHLQALEAACRSLGVDIRGGQTVTAVSGSLQCGTVETASDRFEAAAVVVAAGTWSSPLLASLGVSSPVYPVRGQIVLLRTDVQLPLIIQEGTRYLVPRFDGHVLVGATVENVGFDARTTASGMRSLLDDAVRLVPELASAEIVTQWAGLRPQRDAGPLVGAVGDRVFAACGHYRDGVCLSPGTAVRLADAIAAVS